MMGELRWTGYEQAWIHEGEHFVPHIVPWGERDGNVVAITLDCRRTSTLRWEIPPYTHPYVLWELETDLFDQSEPDEWTICSLELALEHISATLLPHHPTWGILLYRGKPPLPTRLLRSLAAQLPDTVWPYVAVDLTGLAPSERVAALQREELPHIGLMVKGAPTPYAFPALGWGEPSALGSYGRRDTLVPSRRVTTACVYGPAARFQPPSYPCRMIPESLLIYEWEGVDHLISVALSSHGQRAVQGFIATGGTIISLNDTEEPLLP